MGRLVARYRDAGALRWGEIIGAAPTGGGDPVEVARLDVEASTTADLIAAMAGGGVAAGERSRITANRIVSPLTAQAGIFAQGLNYQAHAAEAQHAQRKSNLIFSKASSSLTGPYGDIVRPEEVQLLDYEVEFGLVLRRDLGAGDLVTADNLGDAVAGIVLCNDVSARDTMFGATFLQWFRGKSYRTFCPTGPALWLLEPQEVAPALESLEIALAVNGEERQRARATQLIWPPAETLSYIAASMDMRRGDLLLTGTPGGVTAAASPALVKVLQDHLVAADDARRDALRVEMTRGRPFLQPGDLVTATMTAGGRPLGGLANRVVDATRPGAAPGEAGR